MRPFKLKIERLEVGTHKSITLSTTFISSSHCLCNFFSIFLKFSHFHNLTALMGLLLKVSTFGGTSFYSFLPSLCQFLFNAFFLRIPRSYRIFYIVVSSKYYCLPVRDAVQSARNLYQNTGRSQTTVVFIATAGRNSDAKK